MDVLTRILDYAEASFLKLGVRSNTLNDISTVLGISKKTIYQYFQNKADLVLAVANRHLSKVEAAMELELAKATNAVEELYLLMNCENMSQPKVSPGLILEVQKFYPDTWKAINEHTWGFLREKIHNNLLRGIAESHYRKDLPVEATVRIHIAFFEAGFNSEIFPPDQFNFDQVQRQILEMFLHGIVTESGRVLVHQYFLPSSSANAA